MDEVEDTVNAPPVNDPDGLAPTDMDEVEDTVNAAPDGVPDGLAPIDIDAELDDEMTTLLLAETLLAEMNTLLEITPLLATTPLLDTTILLLLAGNKEELKVPLLVTEEVTLGPLTEMVLVPDMVSVGVSVGLGVASWTILTVLVSRVTAPSPANTRPLITAPEFAVILVRAMTVPEKFEADPSVAEEPHAQKTLPA
jgi:hypothetical protein